MTPLPTDLASPPVFVPFHRLRGLARRLHGCLLRCKEAWLQRVVTAIGTKDTPPVTPPLPLQASRPDLLGVQTIRNRGLLCAHINAATAVARHQRRRWWQRAWDRRWLS